MHPSLHSTPESAEKAASSTDVRVLPADSTEMPSGLKVGRRRPKWLWLVVLATAVALVALAGAFGWYFRQLEPVGGTEDQTRLEIASGSTPSQIASQLQQAGLIRSDRAFDIYIRLNGVRDRLQAGTYSLSPSQSTPDIVASLTSGKVDEFQITFLPGGTVMEARSALIEAGYGEAEVDTALSAQYDHPVLAGRPAGADLEGYIYGETYSFPVSAKPEDILRRTFDQLYGIVERHSLEQAYADHGLSLYEGLTLASIIQREVGRADDQKQVSQVFHRRLALGMPLGADATFVYAAKKLGVPPSVELDSPYNTRIHGGLPPGPISSPGESALVAAAKPAEGDYLYFVSGDNGVNYFSRTLAEHERLTAEHCQVNCRLF